MSHMSIDQALAHYGVKGMKWGVTRDEAVLRRLAGGRQIRSAAATRKQRKAENAEFKKAWKDYKNTTTRKQRREDKKEAIISKGEYILDTLMKDKDALVEVMAPGGYSATLMTGREFTEHMANGGYMAPAFTEISQWRFDKSNG